MRILLLDDTESQLKPRAHVLSSLGHKVYCASSFLAAKKVLQAKRPALIIFDLVLPDVGGEALVDALRLLFPRVRLLVLSSYLGLSPDLLKKVDGYVSKGCNRQVLFDAIDSVRRGVRSHL